MTDATQRLIEAAQAALVSMGMFTPGQICDCAHHSPKNRHALGDVCPVALQFVLDYDNLRAAIAAARQEAEQRPKPVTWLTEHRGNYWPCPPDVPGAFPVYASTPTPAPAAPEHPPTAPSAPAKEQ